jgi:hypothetical protein
MRTALTSLCQRLLIVSILWKKILQTPSREQICGKSMQRICRRFYRMKITLDLPNDTCCCFVNFVRGDILGLTMQSHAITGAELRAGGVIEIKPGDTE